MGIVDDDMKEDSIYSFLSESVNLLSLSDNAPSSSPNNLVWTNSGLNKNPNASNTDWNSIKQVLSKVLSSQSTPTDFVNPENNIQLSIDGNHHILRDFVDDNDIGSMEISDDEGNGNFCPNYDEENANIDHSLITWESESLPVDLFNLWDLGISDEQDDFTRQLNEAFGDFTFPIPPNFDDSRERKEVMNVSVNDLVARMGGFSMKQHTK